MECSKTMSSSSGAPKPRLLDQVRQAIHTRHYSPRTEETYVGWIKRFIFYHVLQGLEWVGRISLK